MKKGNFSAQKIQKIGIGKNYYHNNYSLSFLLFNIFHVIVIRSLDRLCHYTDEKTVFRNNVGGQTNFLLTIRPLMKYIKLIVLFVLYN